MITKSTYVKFCQCPKKFWLYLNKRDEMVISDSTKARMKDGTEIGDLAMGLFGDYVDVTTTNNNILDIKEMVNKTAMEINNNTINICEASFIYENLYCAVDILHKTENGYEIYEVKSSTSVNDSYIIDASFQKYVLEKCGLKITSVNIVTINNEYIRHNELEINKLFLINNIDSYVDKEIINVDKNLVNINKLLTCNNEMISKYGSYCKKPYECEFINYCFKDLPKPNIFNLVNSRSIQKFYDKNIITFEDVYNSEFYNKLPLRNKLQIDYYMNDLDITINKKAVREFLNQIKYPLYLLDFESMQPPVPLFDGTKPYQQVPFQYSLHIIEKPGDEAKHKEFLAIEGTNPTYDIAISLINDIPKDAMIMAYNSGYEKARFKELANMYPNLYDELIERYSNFIDLAKPFSNCDVYVKEFEGFYTIKYVLPGLFPNDPELDYHNLDIIHNGSEAMTLYKDLLNYTPLERTKIREALLKYCKLDTYAMVKLLNKLYELCK